MAVPIRFVIRLLLIISLVSSSLPLMPTDRLRTPFSQRPCFEEQALTAPALSDVHDPARRGSAVCVNTIKLFQALSSDKRRMAFKKFPVVLAFLAAVGSPGSSMKEFKASPAPLLVSKAATIKPTLAPQTFTNAFFVTPEFPRYQLRMAEKGTVKSILSAGEAFRANRPVVEITRAPELYQAEENAAQRNVQEFDLRHEKIKKLFEDGLISAEEKQTHDTGRAIAKERLTRARDGLRSRLSFPFPGKVLHVSNGAAAEGSPYLEVADSRVLVVTLTRPQAFLFPGGSGVDVIALVQKGFPVTLSRDGKPISVSHVSVEGETIKFFIPSGHWTENRAQQIDLSVQAPSSAMEEPAYPVRHRIYVDVTAPADGIVKSFRFFQPGARLPAGPHPFLQYDTSSMDSSIRELKTRRDELKANTARAKALADRELNSVDNAERHENDLLHAEEAVAIAERQKADLQNSALRIPWDAVVVRQTLLAQGQRIKKDDPLMTLGSARQFEAELLVDEASAHLLKPRDTITVILEGTGTHFPAVIRELHSATGSQGDQGMELTVDIQDDQGLLHDGALVQYERPSAQGVSTLSLSPSPGQQMVEEILRSTDYGWVRRTMDDAARDARLSQEERARLFNVILQQQNGPALYKEWALIKLVDLGKIDELFRFVQSHSMDDVSRSPNAEDRRLFSFAFRLLHDQLYEVSLYNVPPLLNEEARIDHYLASLIQRDPEKYSPAVELQLLWAQNSHRVLLRWLQIPDLFAEASNEDFRRRGSIFVERAQEPLIGNDLPMHTIVSALKLYHDDFRRDQLAIDDYLKHGNKDLLSTLTAVAPAFVAAVRVPTPLAGPNKSNATLEPLEAFSNNALYFASPTDYGADPRTASSEMSSSGSKTLLYELAGTNDLVLSQTAQDLIHKKDLPGLIHLFNHLPPSGQKVLLSDMAASGLLANTALERETVTWNAPADTVWAEFFRNFYIAALAHVTDPLVRHSLQEAFVRTYQTDIELARAAYAGNDREGFKAMARYDLRLRIAYELLMEHADVLEQKAARMVVRKQKQEIEAARADSIEAARLVLEWRYPLSGHEDTPPLKELLAGSGLSLRDVEERMSHYENAFAHSGQTLWAAPRVFNERTIGIILLLSAILRLFFWKAKKSSDDATGPAVKKSENILKLFSQYGDTSARSFYRVYQNTQASFFALLGVRTVISVLFIGFISFWEAQGNASEFLVLYLGLMTIDQLFNIFLIRKREVFGKLLNDLFPVMLKIEVERMRLGREPNADASPVFSDPVRTAKIFASGQLVSLYTRESLLGILAIAAGLSFVHYGLAIGYLGFTVLFLASVSHLSSKMSWIKTLGENKERLLNQWMQETVLLVKMGFSADTMRPMYGSVATAIDRLIDEKMKYMTGLRVLAVIFPGAGAFVGLPLSTLAISRGLESFFFLPDWAKEMAESKPAEKSIRSFLLAHLRPLSLDPLPKGASIQRLELKHFSLFVPASSQDSGSPSREFMRDVTLDFSVGTLHLLWGVNGSGKTTWLRYLAGLDRATHTSGQAELRGQTSGGAAFAIDVREAGDHVHYFTPSHLTERMTVRTFMDMLKGDDEKYQFRSWIEAADPLGLDFDQTDVSRLSQGQKARLQLAFMLAGTTATVILVDEALAHMDEAAQNVWITLMKDYARRHQKLILMTEKAIVKNAEAVDGVFELKNGEVRIVGSIETAVIPFRKPLERNKNGARKLRRAA